MGRKPPVPQFHSTSSRTSSATHSHFRCRMRPTSASPQGRRGLGAVMRSGFGAPFLSPYAAGSYQIGDENARSWIVLGTTPRGVVPARMASQVDHRHVGFSSTRT